MSQTLELADYMCNCPRLLSQNSSEDVASPVQIENRTYRRRLLDEFHLSFERVWPKIQKYTRVKILTRPLALATCQNFVNYF